MAAQQQLREVHKAAISAQGFVGLIDLLVRNLIQVFTSRHVSRPQAFILLGIDKAHGLTWRPLFGVDIHRLHDPLYQPELIICIQYLEVLRQAGGVPVATQQTMGNTVKGPHPQATRWNIE